MAVYWSAPMQTVSCHLSFHSDWMISWHICLPHLNNLVFCYMNSYSFIYSSTYSYVTKNLIYTWIKFRCQDYTTEKTVILYFCMIFYTFTLPDLLVITENIYFIEDCGLHGWNKAIEKMTQKENLQEISMWKHFISDPKIGSSRQEAFNE